MRLESLPDGPLVLVIEEPAHLSAETWRELRAAGLRTFATADSSAGHEQSSQARLRAAVQAGDVRGAEQLLRETGPQLALNHPETFTGWIETLPGEDLIDYPALRWALVAIAARARPDRLSALLRGPWADTDRRRSAVDRALIRGLRCAVERRLARPGSVATAIALDSMLHDLGPADLAALHGWLPALYAESAMALLYDGRVFHARTVFERGLEAARDPWGRRALGAALALADLVLGNVREARRRRRECPAVDGQYPGDELVAVVDALLEVESGKPDTAYAGLLEVEASSDYRDIVVLARAFVALTSGRSQQAAEELHAWLRSGPVSPALVDVAHGLLVLSRSQDDDVTASADIGLATVVASAQVGDVDRVRDVVARLSEEGMAAPPRLRLHAAVLEFAVIRQLASKKALRLVADRIASLAESEGMTWPLRLLSAGDAAEFVALSDTVVPETLLPDRPPVERLTERERIVLGELVRGGTETEIAARLHLSVNTIKTQRRSLYRKLGVTRRGEAIARGLAMGVLASGGADDDARVPRLGRQS